MPLIAFVNRDRVVIVAHPLRGIASRGPKGPKVPRGSKEFTGAGGVWGQRRRLRLRLQTSHWFGHVQHTFLAIADIGPTPPCLYSRQLVRDSGLDSVMARLNR